MMNLLTEISSETIPCCLCPSAVQWPLRRINSHQLMKCGRCGLVHIEHVSANPVGFLNDVATQEANGPLEYWGYPEVFKKHSAIFEYFFQERFDRINKAHPPNGTWLDVGSGYGLWQNFLKKNKIENDGIEIEPQALKFCVKQGLNVSLADIENWITDKKYAVITLCDVLEHVKDPLAVLKKCHELLIPGGILYVQVPCVLGFRYPFNDSLGLPHHIWQFNPKTLINLTRQSSFDFQTYWTGVQGIIKHYEKGQPSFYRKLLWKLARLTKRGNRLQLLAKKL